MICAIGCIFQFSSPFLFPQKLKLKFPSSIVDTETTKGKGPCVAIFLKTYLLFNIFK